MFDLNNLRPRNQPVPKRHHYKVVLSAIAYFEYECQATTSGEAVGMAKAATQGERWRGVPDPEVHSVAPCEKCRAAGLYVSRDFEVDYTQIVPEPETALKAP